PVPRVDDPDALVGGLDDAPVALLAGPQGPLRLLAGGDVLGERRAPDDRPDPAPDGGGGLGHVDGPAVLAQPDGVERRDVLPPADAGQDVARLLLTAGRDQEGDGPADDLGVGVAVQPLGAGGPGGDGAAPGPGEGGVGGRLPPRRPG